MENELVKFSNELVKVIKSCEIMVEINLNDG